MMMTRTRGNRLSFQALGLSTLSAVVLVAAPFSAIQAAAVIVPPKVVTFNMPAWSPLRTPTLISCVKTNCPGPYHGDWAIDFIDLDKSNFDPLYAVAPGIVHIGEITGPNVCLPGVTSYGTWIWIDHGNGRSTRYTHLDSVMVKEGQRVTPKTNIGWMGHSGNNFPCRIEYLHLEFRVNNVKVEPPAMFACIGTRKVSLPAHLGYAKWDLVPANLHPIKSPARNVFTPGTTNACML